MGVNYRKSLGLVKGGEAGIQSRKNFKRYINLKLAALGQPYFVRKQEDWEESPDDYRKDIEFIELLEDFLANVDEKSRLLADHLCPSDRRIQDFLCAYLGKDAPLLPSRTLILDRHGIARELAIPPDQDHFENRYISSYRIKQGILHNPLHDKRTTKGTFHIADGGLPVPLDKKEVPKAVFGELLRAAWQAPDELTEVPFTASQPYRAHAWVSLFMRPPVLPEVPGEVKGMSMETRFFVPAGLVATLDFVESVFGNAGDPLLVSNDSALDVEGWTGHTGCIILAPHILSLTKKEVGLPHIDDATDRQRAEGMCWEDENELYNDGSPFKITARDERGVCITIIADNYFGYSKKEVKTQITYSANLLGLAEEEHAGGTVVFPRYNLADHAWAKTDHSFDDMRTAYPDLIDFRAEGYGIDRQYPHIHYIPETARFDLWGEKVKWDGGWLKLLPERVYIYPDGYKIHMEKHEGSWRLVGTVADGIFCHKPCTVSGGGKSEISKSLDNAIIYGPFYINDFEADMKLAEDVIERDYSDRWLEHKKRDKPSRRVLDPTRSLGSVIKLLTPSEHHTDEYRDWLDSIPSHVRALVLFIKRHHRDQDDDWRSLFTTNRINGQRGHELFYKDKKIVAAYLRVGFSEEGDWLVHRLRPDFIPSAKIQMEDDITVSVTLDSVPFARDDRAGASVKLLTNAEYRLFQRPDEAIHKGYDKEAEADLARSDVFITNYEPLTPEDGREMIEDPIGFDQYTPPIQRIINEGAEGDSFFISPSHPRMMGERMSTNPRYLQTRHDFSRPQDYHIAEMGIRLKRRIPQDKPVHYPVDSVIPARRNNPPEKEKGIKGLSVYGPLHYQELPELFMDFVASLSGKSPSTTGAGSEGALTKGPFNMLSPVYDLNAALLSYILTGYNGWSSAAGHIGVSHRFDHDISILIPEFFARIHKELSKPQALIEEGSLEEVKVENPVWAGKPVDVGRLGYRITGEFLFRYAGRVFDQPGRIFTEQMLRPEKEDMDAFLEGVDNIVQSQRRVAIRYFEDGSVEKAIPPLAALLNIMAHGTWQGKGRDNPDFRKLFDREYVLNSDWYNERLKLKQKKDMERIKSRIADLEGFIAVKNNARLAQSLGIDEKITEAEKTLKRLSSEGYLQSLKGTVGVGEM